MIVHFHFADGRDQTKKISGRRGLPVKVMLLAEHKPCAGVAREICGICLGTRAPKSYIFGLVYEDGKPVYRELM